MRNKKLLFILGIILVCVIGVAAFVFLQKTPNEKSTPENPTPTPSSDIISPPEDKLSEKEIAAELFSDVTEIEGWNKEEIQLALYSTQRYIDLAFNDPNLVNTVWEKDNFPRKYLEGRISRYYTLDAWSEIASDLDTLEQTQDMAAQGEILRKLIAYVLVVDPRNQDFAPYPSCSNSTLNSCLEGEKPSIGEWKYFPTENPEVLKIEVEVNSPLIYQRPSIGENGIISFTHKLSFSVTPNEFADEDADAPPFAIDGVQSDWTTTGWKTKRTGEV